MDQRKKKIYIILLVGSGVVLFVNYVLFSDEEVRRVAPVGATTVSLKTVGATKAITSADAIPELVFPRELPSWPTEGRNRDIFAAPYETVSGTHASDALIAGSIRSSGNQNIGRAEFADNHRLQMVLDDKQRPIAVVDDQWLHLGDEIDQCKLLSVKGTTALFDCYDGEVLLELENSLSK